MSTVSRGFQGRRLYVELPPGQYLVEDFLSCGTDPSIELEDWELTITSETDEQRRWDWAGFRALPSEQVTVDLHCVTHWSKLHTTWEGVPRTPCSTAWTQRQLRAGHPRRLQHQPAAGGPDRPQAWIAFRYDGQELEPEHGGPARLLVPHLYLWKSAKWVRGIQLLDQDEPGFWESLGYHNYGDPWQEQRFWGD